jgi:hypothetical protein
LASKIKRPLAADEGPFDLCSVSCFSSCRTHGPSRLAKVEAKKAKIETKGIGDPVRLASWTELLTGEKRAQPHSGVGAVPPIHMQKKETFHNANSPLGRPPNPG